MCAHLVQIKLTDYLSFWVSLDFSKVFEKISYKKEVESYLDDSIILIPMFWKLSQKFVG